MNWLKNLFFGGPKGSSSSRAGTTSKDSDRQGLSTSGSAVLHSPPVRFQYPSSDDGYDRVSPTDILESFNTEVNQLKGLIAPDLYKQAIEPTLIAMAEWVLNLPRSEHEEFMNPGGLLRSGIETAFHAHRLAESSLFALSERVEKRLRVEKQWCATAALAGLFSHIHKVLDIIVIAEDGDAWSHYLEPLDRFCSTKDCSRFYISFRPSPDSREHGSTLAKIIIPDTVLQFLDDGHPDLLPALFKAIDGKSYPEAPRLWEVLDQAINGVLKHEKMRQPKTYGRVRQGTHLEPYIIDGIRLLVPDLIINQDNGNCWHSASGTYLSVSLVHLVISRLREKQILGIPDAPETIADILHRIKVIRANQDGRLFWQIFPDNINMVEAINIIDPDTLFNWAQTPDYYEGSLKLDRRKKRTADSIEQDPAEYDSSQLSIDLGENAHHKTETETIIPHDAGKDKSQAALNEADLKESYPTDSLAAPSIEHAKPTQIIVTSSKRERKKKNSDKEKDSRSLFDSHDLKGNAPDHHIDNDQHVDQEVEDNNQAVSEAKPVRLKLSDKAELLLNDLSSPLVKNFLRSVVTDFNSGKTDGMAWCEFGFAIHKLILYRYGVDELNLYAKLFEPGWIAKNPSKPAQKLLDVNFIDGKAKAIVIKSIVAKDLGIKHE